MPSGTPLTTPDTIRSYTSPLSDCGPNTCPGQPSVNQQAAVETGKVSMSDTCMTFYVARSRCHVTKAGDLRNCGGQ
eukprot:scaffold90350_cov48-Prasinocladus_malaysianus.AAC.2